jgi:hypothetical protein
MSLKVLKSLTVVVCVCVVGEVVCLGGTIYTAIQRHRYDADNTPKNIVVPAGIPVPQVGK